MGPGCSRILERVLGFFRTVDAVLRGKAVETVACEIEELENIFGLLVLGAFVGIPSPPVHISMDLLPLMERERRIMLEKTSTAHDPLGELFSVFDIS